MEEVEIQGCRVSEHLKRKKNSDLLYLQRTYSSLPVTICGRGPKETALGSGVTRSI
jgi:hypothetical protein